VFSNLKIQKRHAKFSNEFKLIDGAFTAEEAQPKHNNSLHHLQKIDYHNREESNTSDQ
jgi:hypothetical protein